MEEEIIFNKLENLIKSIEIDNYNLYDACSKEEKLTVTQNSNNSLSFKVLKNYILLKFNKMKKVNNTIEMRITNNSYLEKIRNKTNKMQYNPNTSYVKISIENISDIDLYSEILVKNFKDFFKKYMNTEEQFGCCSLYTECSDNLQCINNDIRTRLSCLYKHNLDKGKIFYGKNKNI